MGLGISGTRISNNLLAQQAVRSVSSNMHQMLELQYQLATGLRLYKPSVDPAGAAVTLAFQNVIERRSQTCSSIDRANEFLTTTDSALADLQDLLNEAVSVASSNVGAASDDASRQNAATVVASLLSQLVQIGNRQYQGRYIFAGRDNDVAPFDLSGSAVNFVGDSQSLYINLDRTGSLPYNVTAEEAFGTATGRVVSLDDLDPAVTLATRLSELNAGDGVRRGTIILSDGTDSVQIDLSRCNTVNDVIQAIDANGVIGVTAAVNAAKNGLVIQGDPAATLSVTDLPGGCTARDLGIYQPDPLGAGVDLVGLDLDRTLTPGTELSALRGGVGVDQLHGMRLVVGSDIAQIALDGASTIEDLINEFNFCGLNVQASIDDEGRRLVVANNVSSAAMTIGERAGTTATELGLRTMHADTLLSGLNEGRGVRTAGGATDFNIITRDGSVIPVAVAGLATVGDIIDAINANPANGGRVIADLAAAGNGLRLRDTTAGAGDFRVVADNSSFAAKDLGIDKTIVNPGGTLNGSDVNPVVEQGVFRELFALRDALLANDSAAITQAGAALQNQIARVARTRGIVGVRMQTLDQTKKRVEEELLQVNTLMSNVRDLDYAEAIARLQSLQAMFQASLQATGTVLPMTLLDFVSL